MNHGAALYRTTARGGEVVNLRAREATRSGLAQSTSATAPVKYYETRRGCAWLGDAKDVLRSTRANTVQAIITSPPFALRKKKRYGNVPEDRYVDWFMGFADDFRRVLKDDGSLVIEIGGAWLPGDPIRSIYHFELLVKLVRDGGFYLAEEFFWLNRAKLPSPAEWVNVKRVRVKDAVTPIWWLSKTPHPKANNRNVLRPYSESMKHLLVHGYNRGRRPSGHVVREGFTKDNGGAIPPNLIEISHTQSYDPYQDYCREHGLTPHPARFPREIPDFFIKFLTEPDDMVLDPFAGSNMTGAVAEALRRRWRVAELREVYLQGSIGRFDPERLINVREASQS